MYTDDNTRALRTFDGEIYGSDENLQNTFEFTQYEAVRLPVFGVKMKMRLSSELRKTEPNPAEW